MKKKKMFKILDKNLETKGLISIRQLKAIWALAHRAGFTEEDLHSLVESFSGKKSIRSLNRQEARQVIEDLLFKVEGSDLPSLEATGEEGKITRAQMILMEGLSRPMGWDLQRLLRLARKMYGAGNLVDLKVRQASGLIEALKAIKRRYVLDRTNRVKGHAA
jgi:hypothetical protein